MTKQISEPTPVPLEVFDGEIKADLVEVSTSALGGKVIACSDDFFESCHNLIKASPSVSMKGQYGPNGARYDGWESRRHCPTFDWVIIQLGPHESHISYVDIDTSHFSGNEAPQSQVFGLRLDKPAGDNLRLSTSDPRWVEILPVVTLGPNSRHIFELGAAAKDGVWSALMVRMIPDGGMARFRAYGHPLKPKLLSALPPATVEPTNLLSPVIGGHIVACSDANFSPPGNLLLMGRGHDMSDGWETRRSQHNRGKYAPGAPLHGQERKEWVIGKLGVPGVISHVEIDSAYHVGNYPVASGVEACYTDDEVPAADTRWVQIVRKQPLGPHRQHWFALDDGHTAVFSHVRCSIYPDGGLKRLRIFGYPMEPTAQIAAPATKEIMALPLTYEAFKPYGSVLQGWDSWMSAPKGVPVTSANQSTAAKFHRLAPLPETPFALTQVRNASQIEVHAGATIALTKLKRVSGTNVFIPQGVGAPQGETPLKAGGATVVAVALSDAEGNPDLSTLRAFVATAAQGLVCKEGTWRTHLITVNNTMDYVCYEQAKGKALYGHFADIVVPPYNPVLVEAPAPSQAPSTASRLSDALITSTISHPVPITASAFAPFGEIIAASDDAMKVQNAVSVSNSYPKDANAVSSIGVYRAVKKAGLERGKVFDIQYMERHPYTSQAFIPMGKASWEGKGESALGRGGSFLVVVAENGPDDRPDPATLKTFTMESGTGLNYKPGTWHHPVLVLDDTLDLACIETQVSTGAGNDEPDARDCELITYSAVPFGRIAVPEV